MNIKRSLALSVMVVAGLSMTACFSDDSTLGVDKIGTIEVVTGMEDTSYIATAFIGEVLEIKPEVTTTLDESELSYEWTLLSDKTGTIDVNGDTIQPQVIGNSKYLAYTVDAPAGQYQIRYAITVNDGGYTLITATDLSVVTEFSQGFYILKESADGNTDMDMYSAGGNLSQNIISNTTGATLSGKPYSITPNYGQFYINPDNDQMEATNTMVVITEDKQMGVYRTTDMLQIFDQNSILFDGAAEGEQPYLLNRSGWYSQYFTSEGMRYGMTASMGSPTSGKYGFVSDQVHGSKFFICDYVNSMGGFFIWDEVNKDILWANYNMYFEPIINMEYGEEYSKGLTDWECLSIGYSAMDYVANFILNNTKTGARRLYLASGGMMASSLNALVELDPASHMAKATAYSTNVNQAKYIYCVDGGKLYACNLNSDTYAEIDVHLAGIGAGEEITYVSNQFFQPTWDYTDDSFDYLVVGTQKGNEYHVYMYNMVGGMPSGDPVISFGGDGKVAGVRYINQGYSENDLGMMAFSLMYTIVD